MTAVQRLVLVALAVVLAAGAPVEASSIVDQSFKPSLTSHLDLQDGSQFAQTFTVGLSGLLTGIDLSIGRETNPVATGDLLISLLGTVGGVPDVTAPLATVTAPDSLWVFRDSSSDAASYRHLEITPVVVTAGDVLAISVRQVVADSSHFYWYGGGDGLGAAGAPFGLGPHGWTELPGIDLAFQTYVAVPEAAPGLASFLGVFVLMILGSRFKGM